MPTYTVTSVTEDQVEDDAGNLEDVFRITFTLPDRPGSFNTVVLQAGAPVTAASDAISEKVAEIEGIYGLG